ncbi:MAG: FAD-dependent oxidoreductase [Oscillospiraceae bacterium]|nr:FAD-dependent oxidoreductase [Oscillospiraceae bacterium]
MRYVIIGNSAAGVGAVEGIRKVTQSGEITVISNEPHHTYSRPLISYLLQGKADESKMKYRSDSFCEDNNCTLLFNTVTKIDVGTKQFTLQSGENLPYDKLLVATGSSPFVPPIKGLDSVEDRFTFMSLDDAKLLDSKLAPTKKVLIIGAGLIGLKCAEGILARVGGITVIDLAPRILSSILDDGGAEMVQKHLESKGIEFKLSSSVEQFEVNTAVLNGGEKIDFDILVLAVGVRPNVTLLKDIAEIDKGIIVNAKSETSCPDIYAAGDCTQSIDVSDGQSKVMALLPNSYMQGEAAGINMAGGEELKTVAAIPMNAIGFFGMKVITAGNYIGEVYSQESENAYKRLFFSDNRLNGYIIIGEVEKAGIYTALIRDGTPLDSIDFRLICENPGLMAFTKDVRKLKLGGFEHDFIS